MSATHKVQVNVGSLAEMGKRFSKAWNQAAAGEQVDETNVTFLDVQTMLDTLSPRRLDLLRHVRQYGASNVRELAPGASAARWNHSPPITAPAPTSARSTPERPGPRARANLP